MWYGRQTQIIVIQCNAYNRSLHKRRVATVFGTWGGSATEITRQRKSERHLRQSNQSRQKLGACSENSKNYVPGV